MSEESSVVVSSPDDAGVDETAGPTISVAPPPGRQRSRSVVGHAKLIGAITLISRIVGLAREMIAFRCFGDTGVWAAWKVAFTVPNLFRKLLGEGALSAAFVPLYAQAVKRDEETGSGAASSAPANEFAAAAVNVLGAILVTLTVGGEVVLIGLLLGFDWSPNNLLMLRFSVVMLPYVTLVCLTAFLGGILQVHHRFTAFAFTAVVLNLFLIVVIVAVARAFDLHDRTQQIRAAYWLSAGVLAAGAGQLAILIPSLVTAGFRWRVMLHCWTPSVKQLMLLTLPLAGGAGVLQIGVMLDKGIAQFLANSPMKGNFSLFGHLIRFPIQEGAAARLDLAQFMYQFPLGVFAIALATAIFPTLGREAVNPTGEGFKKALRQGIEGALFIALPASAGMILIAKPAVHLLFQGGQFSGASADWVALSTALYSGAIWAFSMLQIINRGFYSLRDARTPLRWTAYNLLINLVIEIPLLWTGLGESAMAVGTLVSFTIQALAMLWLLDRRVGGMNLSSNLPAVAKMVGATAVMTLACVLIQQTPIYPHAVGRVSWAGQSIITVGVGAIAYFATCASSGIDVMQHVRLRRR